MAFFARGAAIGLPPVKRSQIGHVTLAGRNTNLSTCLTFYYQKV